MLSARTDDGQFADAFPDCRYRLVVDGVPPGWGWIVLPMFPPMQVSFGMLLVLGTVVVGRYGGLVWVRDDF
jgi:hypothetical protein